MSISRAIRKGVQSLVRTKIREKVGVKNDAETTRGVIFDVKKLLTF